MPSGESTFAVTVTYGDRFRLVEQVVDAALANGVAKVVVVDNGASNPSKRSLRALEEARPQLLVIVEMPGNLGSAAGFKAGIEYAVGSSDCEFIWLLDDDNRPDEKAHLALVRQFKEQSRVVAKDRLALASTRWEWDQHRKVAQGFPVPKAFPRSSSFMGFHLLIPPRLVSRLFGLDRIKGASVSAAIEIPIAPYGGLFFHKSVIAKLGLPNETFFLYNDDSEFTYRFTSGGGKLFLVPSSVIRDLDLSWHVVHEGETFVSHFLLADADWRVYYAVRNQSYVSRHLWARNSAVYRLNRAAFFTVLCFYAIKHRKWQRFCLIWRAAREGELGQLGRCAQYP